MAGDVGEHGESGGRDDGASDGQTVEAIGEVDGVGRAEPNEDYKSNEGNKDEKTEQRNRGRPVPDQIWMPGLDEGYGQLRGEKPELGEDRECGCDRCCNDCLPEEFGTRGEAEVPPFDHLDVVIGKPNGAEGERGKNRDPDEGI